MHDIRTTHYQDYTILLKNDQVDYLGMFKRFCDGELETEAIPVSHSMHKVWRAKYADKTYIIKLDQEKPKHLENKIWAWLQGPFYSKQMKGVRKAIANGCQSVPDIYLVAEKRGRFLCESSIIIMEFITGTKHSPQDKSKAAHKLLADAMLDIHKHGLALGDCNAGNFLITENGCKIIDLSWHGSALIGKAQDITAMQRRYGISIPAKNAAEKMALLYMKLKKAIRRGLKKIRRKS